MPRRVATATVAGSPRIVDLLAPSQSRPPVTGVFGVAGSGNAQVFFNETDTSGAIVTVTASTGQVATGTTSPITVNGLPNGTTVTFTATRSGSRPSLTSDPVTPNATPGVVYYVDAEAGNDTAAGTTSGAPLRTLANAAALALQPGDAVLLRRGRAWPGESFQPTAGLSGATGRPITVGAYGTGPAPLLYQGVALAGWLPAAGTNTFRAPFARASGSYPGVLYRNRTPSRLGGGATTLTNGQWWYDGAYVYYRQDSGHPATDGALYEAAAGDVAVKLVGCTDWVVRDLNVVLSNRLGIEATRNPTTLAECARIVFAENRVEHVGSQSTLTGVPTGFNNGALAFGWVTDGVMRGNYAYSCHTDLYYWLGGVNCQLVDNIGLASHGESGDIFQCDHSGDTANRPISSNIYVARNYFDQTGTTSPKGCIIAFAQGGVIERNTCIGGNFGISYPGSNLEVRFNKIYNVGIATNLDWTGGLYSANNGLDTTGSLVHHNLVVGCLNGISAPENTTRHNHRYYNNTIVNCTRRAAEFSGSWDPAQPSHFENNLLYNPSSSQGELRVATTSGLVCDHNLYSAERTTLFNTGPSYTGYNTMAAWRAATGLDTTSGVTSNPQFVDTATYAVDRGSPARDAGVVVAGITTGFRNLAPDIGYLESV